MSIISNLCQTALIIFCVSSYGLSSFFSVVHAIEIEAGNSTTVVKETPPPATQQSAISAEQHKQFKDIVDSVVAKSTDDSKAIANLTNVIYYLTLMMMFVTLFAPLVMFFLQNKQMDVMKEMVKQKTNAIETKLTDELMEVLKQKINTRVDNYGEFMTTRLEQQNNAYEKCLYHVEEVRSELLKQSKPAKCATIDDLSDWIIEQQKDYYMLLQLISPNTDETFTALDQFRQPDKKLPISFLSLLRFLDEQSRLPGGSKLIAEKIVQEKFGESLEPQAK
jgi:hypothetical protein